MARLMFQAAVAIAVLALVLQYVGLLPRIPGFDFVSPRLGGGGSGAGTINTQKLLVDLNSDITHTEAQSGGSGDERRDEQTKRAASAALSVMYLAAMPGLQEQVKQAPGIVDSLLRRILTVDLAEAHQALQQQQRRAKQQQQQGQQAELLSAALLAVAKVAAGDDDMQRWLLGIAKSKVSGRSKRVPEGRLLSRLDEILRSGVPTWQAAASVLLHALAGDRLDQQKVLSWAAWRADDLIDQGMSLVEAGAHFNSTDAVLAGAQLLEVVAAQHDGRQKLVESEAPAVIVQVVITYAGANTSSSLVGGATSVLHRLTARVGDDGHAAEEPARRELAQEAVRNLVSKGLLAPLVREVRLGQRASLGPCLELLAHMLREDGSEDNDVALEAVGSGILSLCAQLLFKAGADPEPRTQCSYIVNHVTARRRSPNADPEDPPGDDDDRGSGVGAAAPGRVFHDTKPGRAALASDLLRIMRETDYPGLHNAVVEACRDAAPSRVAAEALVAAGVVPHLSLILAHNTTKGYEQGDDNAGNAWILQSQRSAAAVVGLLALHAPLRDRLITDGALVGLATALHVHSGQPGLMGQVRVTAAAALVPLIGEDGQYDQLAVAAGVLEPLVRMYYSRSEQERQVASRVMQLLGRDQAVADMYERVGIKP